MANTYTQLYFHIVFTVKGRSNLISPNWSEQLYKYIAGIISNKNQKLIIINGMPDHLHLLVSMKPDGCLSDLVRDIKVNSCRFINEQKWLVSKFEWQTGFGAFTLGHSQIDRVIAYIKNQEEHHRTKTFKEEYIEFLERYKVDYKPEYLFDDV